MIGAEGFPSYVDHTFPAGSSVPLLCSVSGLTEVVGAAKQLAPSSAPGPTCSPTSRKALARVSCSSLPHTAFHHPHWPTLQTHAATRTLRRRSVSPVCSFRRLSRSLRRARAAAASPSGGDDVTSQHPTPCRSSGAAARVATALPRVTALPALGRRERAATSGAAGVPGVPECPRRAVTSHRRTRVRGRRGSDRQRQRRRLKNEIGGRCQRHCKQSCRENRARRARTGAAVGFTEAWPCSAANERP